MQILGPNFSFINNSDIIFSGCITNMLCLPILEYMFMICRNITFIIFAYAICAIVVTNSVVQLKAFIPQTCILFHKKIPKHEKMLP